MKKSNVSTMLTCLGGIGLIGTVVTAVKATPKALKLLEEAKEEKGDGLTKTEVVKIAGPAYIPSVAIGTATLVCIFGANALNKRQQASLISAYGMLENSYKQYRRKVKELYGEEGELEVVKEVAEEEFPEEPEPQFPDDKVLFLDFQRLEYFRARVQDVLVKCETDDGMEYYVINSPFDEVPDYGY